MGTRNHNGQALIELIICALFLASFFLLGSELASTAIHAQQLSRFSAARRSLK